MMLFLESVSDSIRAYNPYRDTGGDIQKTTSEGGSTESEGGFYGVTECPCIHPSDIETLLIHITECYDRRRQHGEQQCL